MVTWLDLRRALRALSRAPVFAFVGIVSIGASLGGTALLFALLNAVALRPPPYRNSERLFEFSQTAAAGCDTACPDLASPLQVRDWMSAFNGSVSHALVRIEEAVVDRSEWSRVETVARVSDGFFQLLGTQPSYGRIPGAGQIPDGNAVVLGERLAKEIFGEGSLAVGAKLRIDAQSRLVVAVMPRDFAYPSSSELWVLDPSIGAEASAAPRVMVIGRLPEGVSLDALAHRFDVAVKRRAAAFKPDKPWRKGFLTPLKNDKGRARGLWLLLAVSLLTSCAACWTGGPSVASPPVKGRSVATLLLPWHDERLPLPPLLLPPVVLLEVPHADSAAIPMTPTKCSNRFDKIMKISKTGELVVCLSTRRRGALSIGDPFGSRGRATPGTCQRKQTHVQRCSRGGRSHWQRSSRRRSA